MVHQELIEQQERIESRRGVSTVGIRYLVSNMMGYSSHGVRVKSGTPGESRTTNSTTTEYGKKKRRIACNDGGNCYDDRNQQDMTYA
jgi:hypothetical protein